MSNGWEGEIDLEEALELRHEAVWHEIVNDSRWTVTRSYVVLWDGTPTGYAIFLLATPKSENDGMRDVNGRTIKLHAAESYSVTAWRVAK